MHEIIYLDDGFKVEYYQIDTSAPTFICFQLFDNKYHPTKPGDFDREFGKSAILNFGYNCIQFITNKNDWYQTDGIIEAIRATVKRIPVNNRIITYGSSMGGYAAINFSGQLNADFFIAFSPQVSILPRLMKEHMDTRWRSEGSAISFNHDYIIDRKVLDKNGLVFYDKMSQDLWHADKIKDLSKARLIHVPYSRHASGKMLNKLYGLKRMLKEVVDGKFSLEKCQIEITSKAGESSEISGDNITKKISRKEFIKLCILEKGSLGKDFFLNAINRAVVDNDLDIFAVIILLFDKTGDRMSSIPALGQAFFSACELFSLFEKSIDFALKFKLRPEIKKCLSQDHCWLFLESDSVDVEFLRDLALFVEKDDIRTAYKIMKLASKRRPEGPLIKRKMTEYKNKHQLS